MFSRTSELVATTTTVCFLTLIGVAGWSETATGATPGADGAAIRGLRMIDLSGGRHHLLEEVGLKGTAIVFLSVDCPICTQYVPELNRLSKEFYDQRVAFYGVIADGTLPRSAATEFQKSFAVTFPILFDASGELVAALRPTVAPEAFLLDASGRVVYRGRIDDLYPSVGKRAVAATNRDLHAAFTSVINGNAVENPSTDPVGCRFEFRDSVAKRVSFNRHVASILYANCTECHRAGEVAPFSLISYEDAAKRAEWIGEVVESGFMPPWRATHGYGHFIAERRLTEHQKNLIREWIEAGAPKGEDADLPLLPTYPSGWTLGEPDVVLEAPHTVTVPAEGPDIFHHFVVPLGFDQDKEIIAVEYRPGNPRAVHHAVLLMDTSGAGRKRDEATPEPGYTTTGGVGIPLAGVLTVWAPGVTARYLPEGIAIKAPKEAEVVVQLHLHPSGKIEEDRSKIGIFFAKKPAERHVMNRPFIFGPIHVDIPPGAKEHKLSASMKLPVDLSFTAVLPHMHLIGKNMKVFAILPDGSEKPIIWIKDWNFYWQDQYVYHQPLALPKGTTLHIEATYDNSESNPFNPFKPPVRMMFGEQTQDEMCLALFQAVAEKPSDSVAIRNAVIGNILSQIAKPDVSPEFRKHIASRMREFAGPEMRNMLAEDVLSVRTSEGGATER